MEEIEINLGQLHVLVMCKEASLKSLPMHQKELIAQSIASELTRRLEEKFQGTFEFRVTSIVDGCLNINYDAIWKVPKEVINTTGALAGIASLAITLFADADVNKIPTPISPDKPEVMCQAQHFSNQLADGCVLVQSGDTLSEIAQTIKKPGFSLDQTMVAIFLKNENAFIDKNVDLIRAKEVLLLPTAEEIASISQKDVNEALK